MGVDNSLTSRHEMQFDVIIVGGGFAGITAARDLQKRGLKTIVLEARDRLGGRVFYAERNGHHIELGGTWIHWSQPFVWAETQRYGLEVVDTPGCVAERVVVKYGGAVHELKEEQLGEFVEGFEKFFAEAKAVWERPYDSKYTWDQIISHEHTSVAQRLAALELTPLQAATIGGFLSILSMHHPQGASYIEMMRCYALCGWNYTVFNDTGARYKLEKGTKALVDAIVSDGGFEVALNTKIAVVRQDKDSASVQTSEGQLLKARAVIVTVPLNVLDTVTFEPPIHSLKMQAASEKHAGGGSKVFLEVEGDPGAFMLLSRSEDSPLIGSFTYKQGKDRSVLVGFSLDPDALSKSAKEWQAIFEEFVPGIKVLSTFGHDWGRDEFALGSWCTYKPGQFSRFAKELQRHEKRIFFASADHAEGWRGFIEGAISSGSKTAVAVFDMIGK